MMKAKRKRMKNPRIRSDGYAKDVVYSLDIDCIRANSAQPRKDFDLDSIVKLADSIRRYGILQPLTVRRVLKESEDRLEESLRKKRNLVADLLRATEGDTEPQGAVEPRETVWDGVYVSRETRPLQLCIPDNIPVIGSEFEDLRQKCEENGDLGAKRTADRATIASSRVATPSVFIPDDTCQYELIAGERRLRAARMLGMREVPCIIMNAGDGLSAELALVENMLRENLNMFEQAEAFEHLSKKYSLTQEEIAAKMSLSQSAVANKIRLLRLSAGERDAILESGLTERHARAFLRIPDEALRETCIHTVIARKMNVNDTDRYVTALLERAAAPEEAESGEITRPTPDKLCANIYKFINRMQTASGNYLVVNRRSDDKNVVITLTIRKGS